MKTRAAVAFEAKRHTGADALDGLDSQGLLRRGGSIGSVGVIERA